MRVSVRGFEVLWRPRSTLREVGERRYRLIGGVAVVISWGLASLVLSLISFSDGGVSRAQFPELPPGEFVRLRSGLQLVLPALAFLLPFVWWAGLSALIHPAALLFGGRGTLASTFTFVGIACAPWVVAGASQISLALVQDVTGVGALGGVSLALSVAALLWHAALVVVGVREATRIGYGGAAGSCALSGLGCAVAALLLGVTLAAFVVALSGLPGG